MGKGSGVVRAPFFMPSSVGRRCSSGYRAGDVVAGGEVALEQVGWEE